MADHNNPRYRPDASFGREPGNPGQANDPLAELARLIGRNDPFAELDRAAAAAREAEARHAAEPPQQHYPSDPAPAHHYPNDPAPPHHYPSASAPQYQHPDAPVQLPPLPRFGSDPLYDDPPPRQDYAAQHYSASPPQQPDWPPAPAAPPPPHYAHDPFALPSGASSHQPPAGDPRFASPNFAAPRAHPPGGDFGPDLPRFDPPPYQAGHDRPPFPPPLYPSEPEAGAMPPPHDDEFYDDAPRNGRRKGMVTVLAVLALAVLGTAAAFGYRSLFGGASTSPPPIIRASNEPAKVAPPKTAAVDPNANKINYDRFSDRGQNEQVVVREEKPVDTSELARAAPARAVVPAVPTLTSPPQAATGANPPSAIGEPRRVRTVPIRPDGPESAVPPQSVASQPPPAAPAPSPQRRAAAAPPPANAPLDVTPSAQASSRAVPQPQQPPARAPVQRQAAAPASNAPLSLSPDANLPPPQSQVAVREPPPPRAARPTTAASGGGRYHVQVSSQRSEADAEAAYRAIQSRYRNVLGGHGHVVQRADLGSRGVYYRAMVGPFGSRDEAVQVCTSLKAAGGDCLVQSN